MIITSMDYLIKICNYIQIFEMLICILLCAIVEFSVSSNCPTNESVVDFASLELEDDNNNQNASTYLKVERQIKPLDSGNLSAASVRRSIFGPVVSSDHSI